MMKKKLARLLSPLLGAAALMLTTLAGAIPCPGTPAEECLCVNTPVSFPSLPGAPEWEDWTGDGFWRPEVHDPRWSGSPLQYLSASSEGETDAVDVSWRVVQAGNYLYILVETEVTDDAWPGTTFDEIQLGLTEGASSTAHAFNFRLNKGAAIAVPSSSVPSDTGFDLDPSLSLYWQSDASGSFASVLPSTMPNWLEFPAIWEIPEGGAHRWAFTVRIDLSAAGGLSGDMKLFVGARVVTSATDVTYANVTPEAIQPSGVGSTSNIPPSTSNWQRVAEIGTTCSDSGSAAAEQCIAQPDAEGDLAGPPIWFDPSPNSGTWRSELNDPRWKPSRLIYLCPEENVDDCAPANAVARARLLLSGTDLYVAFHALSDDTIDTGDDFAFIGFGEPSPTVGANFAKILLDHQGTKSDAAPISDPNPPIENSSSTVQFGRASWAESATNWGAPTNGYPPPISPATESWLQEVGSWTDSPGATWGITLRIDLSQFGYVAPIVTSLPIFLGVRYTDSFGEVVSAPPSTDTIEGLETVIPADRNKWPSYLPPSSGCADFTDCSGGQCLCLTDGASVPGLIDGPEWVDMDGDGYVLDAFDDPRWSSSPSYYLTHSNQQSDSEPSMSWQAITLDNQLYLKVESTGVDNEWPGDNENVDEIQLGLASAFGTSTEVVRIGLLKSDPASSEGTQSRQHAPFSLDPSLTSYFEATEGGSFKGVSPSEGVPSWLSFSTVWEEHVDDGYRWGFTARIDLDSINEGFDSEELRMFLGSKLALQNQALFFANVPPTGDANLGVGGVTQVPLDSSLWQTIAAPVTVCPHDVSIAEGRLDDGSPCVEDESCSSSSCNSGLCGSAPNDPDDPDGSNDSDTGSTNEGGASSSQDERDEDDPKTSSDGGASGSTDDKDVGEDAAGCGCHTGPKKPSGSAWWVALGALALILGRRRSAIMFAKLKDRSK